MQAARVVWDLVGEEHTEILPLPGGGAALLFHGSGVGTEDTDLAIIRESLDKLGGTISVTSTLSRQDGSRGVTCTS